MAKSPAFQFYPNDWMHDLDEHPLEIEGAWIRVCCKMWWSETRGRMDKTLPQWARIFRTDEKKALEILTYLKSENLASIPTNLTEPNGHITVISRRMLREEKERQTNCLRQKRHYDKQKPNGDLTATSQRSSSSSSSSSSKDSNNTSPSDSCAKPKKLTEYPPEFEAIWKAYPKRVEKPKALKAWKALKGTPSNQEILAAIEKHKTWRAWREGFIPSLERWIKAERWNDEPGLVYEGER